MIRIDQGQQKSFCIWAYFSKKEMGNYEKSFILNDKILGVKILKKIFALFP